jgi:exodeoxyribonuclease V alpha subunit
VADVIAQLREAHLLSMLDEQVARGLTRLVADERPEVVLAAAITSRATRQGHVCLDLSRASSFATDEAGTPHAVMPEARAWSELLRSSKLVGAPDDVTTPLVLTGDRLYLRRYFSYEKRLADCLKRRIDHLESAVDGPLLKAGLDRLFPRISGAPDIQRLAAMVAVARRFCIISGGPGTGKTTTVVKILALLQEQALRANGNQRRLHIMLVAPTGKAAARLSESILDARAGLACEARIKELIPDEATTIHRRLSPIAGSPTRFRHHADNPLPCDVLLVDEASMVDLPLMTRLVEALPAHARLILLGDRNQLASVETGAILGDLCGTATEPSFSAAFAKQLHDLVGEEVPRKGDPAAAPGISDCVVQLQKSWRYGEGSGIEALARAINAGDDEMAAAILSSRQYDDVSLDGGVKDKSLGAPLRIDAMRGYRPFLAATTPRAASDALGAYRVLCAHRTGPFGVEALNPLLETALEEDGLLRVSGRWYSHRPVLVVENDYSVLLYNGDVGVVFPDEEDPRVSRVHFVTADKKERRLAPSRLPHHETVFAMTVHKAQGSEFDEVAVVLPDTATKVLTRELVYTAVTRPRKRVAIFGSLDAFREAVKRPIERASGLKERLWG